MSSSQPKNNKIRNQLVGFAVFLLILAIIMPWILTDKSQKKAQSTPILQSKDISNQLIDNQSINKQTLNSNDGNTINAPDIPYIPESDAINSLEPTEKSVIVPESTSSAVALDGKAYYVQLAALKNRQKIEELVALLTLNNYDVVLNPKNAAANQAVKLQVGPYAKKEQAEEVSKNLSNLTKLNGLIVTN